MTMSNMYEVNHLNLKNYGHRTSPQTAHSSSPASGDDHDPHSLSMNYIGNVNDVTGSALQLNLDALNKADEKRVLAFAADACALCCLQCTGALALMLYMVQIGLWSWTFHEIYTSMPKTFAWEKLLRIYGSHYDDCTDRTGPVEVELKPWTLCPNYYTMPCVPILAIVLLIANLCSGSSCMSRPKSKRMYTMVANCRKQHYLAIYVHSMIRDMTSGLPPTGRWELTQTIQRCCGLTNYTDWVQFLNGTVVDFPKSCYPGQKPSSSESIFKEGCYSKEYSTVRFWAVFEIGLLCAGLVTSLFFLCLATAIHGGARGNWNSRKERRVEDEEDLGTTADVFFVRSPHHRYHHFHHRHHSHGNPPQVLLDDAESGGFHVHQTPGMVVSATDSIMDQR
ncbi:unnamed protein product [Allacma fusca]|uniref:Tetraspanin n=1 Tax=Allacma fusca TaxID=39272 RepID=A0A8J2L7P4_9HEXA|nr:unnamed protein product [Allacma fusca]